MTESTSSRGVTRWLLLLAGAAVAALVLSWATAAHLRRACVEQDTPYLPLCPDQPPPAEVQRDELRKRISANPGDAPAWTQLLTSEGNFAALPGAALTSPNSLSVALWRARSALQAHRIPEGLGILVEVLRYRASPESARLLAQVAATREGPQLLTPFAATAGEWLPQVMNASAELKQPAGTLLPIVSAAMAQGRLPENLRQYYMRMLKGQGQWVDAYGLWLASHKGEVPLLYNGSFDQPIVPDGFDWEFAAQPINRPGLLIQQESVVRRGYTLHLGFTGRGFAAPIVRQYVYAAPGTYRFRGEYMASRLRSERGLVWSVRCTAGRHVVAGRSSELRDTGGAWKVFDFVLSVPADCGAVASVQLETAAEYEAAAGIKGNVSFDAFTLVPSVATE